MNLFKRIDTDGSATVKPHVDRIAFSTDVNAALSEPCIHLVDDVTCEVVEPSTCIGVAAKKMEQEGVSSLFVVSDGQLVGVFTERDLLEKVAERFAKLSEIPIEHLMAVNPTIIHPTDPVSSALSAISDSGHRSLPVTSTKGKLLGVLKPNRIFDYINQYAVI